ncbi:DUF4136 domain-containing protein [Pseudaeromonas sharmana]|uniref:DUF4136 domain-containing protein n=1 Tax=Pseudaeromonas sharmana TaxID=328412 RepID=A0ABV8CMP0_9GAMM
MRHFLPLFALGLVACAQTSEPVDTSVQHEPTVQMTVVGTTLSSWPYSGPITYAIPDDMMYSKEQGKPWLPLLKQAITQRMQELGLTPADPKQADVIVMAGVLGDKEDADRLVFSKLGMDPGANESKKGTLALVLKDRQSNVILWRSALQASSDMPIRAEQARSRAAQSMIDQMTFRLPSAQ